MNTIIENQASTLSLPVNGGCPYWDFIASHYNNFHFCSKVAYVNDLYKILKNEYYQGDTAHRILIVEFENDVLEVSDVYHNGLADLMLLAIKDYFQGDPNSNSVFHFMIDGRVIGGRKFSKESIAVVGNESMRRKLVRQKVEKGQGAFHTFVRGIGESDLFFEITDIKFITAKIIL